MVRTEGLSKPQAGLPRRYRTARASALALAPMLAVSAIAPLGGGCAFPSPPGRASADMSALVVDRQPYRIRVGGALDVRFYKTPELNAAQVPVRNDGKISLDLIGDVQAAGLGTDQLSANLVHDYSRELEEPRIAVIVREFGGQVYVGGEVGKPIAVKYAEGMTALQAIQSAGSFTDRAAYENVILMRRTTDRYEGYRLFLKKALSGEDFTQDVALQPNDVVFVPKSRIANVNLIVEQYVTKNIPTIPIAIGGF